MTIKQDNILKNHKDCTMHSKKDEVQKQTFLINKDDLNNMWVSGSLMICVDIWFFLSNKLCVFYPRDLDQRKGESTSAPRAPFTNFRNYVPSVFWWNRDPTMHVFLYFVVFFLFFDLTMYKIPLKYIFPIWIGSVYSVQ